MSPEVEKLNALKKELCERKTSSLEELALVGDVYANLLEAQAVVVKDGHNIEVDLGGAFSKKSMISDHAKINALKEEIFDRAFIEGTSVILFAHAANAYANLVKAQCKTPVRGFAIDYGGCA